MKRLVSALGILFFVAVLSGSCQRDRCPSYGQADQPAPQEAQTEAMERG